jgi:DNA-binding NarL/FixJ family response regulator
MIRIVIVEDRAAVRQGLLMRLSAEPDMSVVGEAANGVEAIQLVESLHPEVVLMDVAMPVMDGIQTTCLLRQAWPQTTVVVLTIHEDAVTRQRAVDAGAAGFVSKATATDCLLDTIREVARRRRLLANEPLS